MLVTIIFFSCLYILCFSTLNSFAGDTLIPSENGLLSDGQTIISEGEIFELGFFTPAGRSDERRYVGIWYKFDPKTVVWVADRNSALSGTGGFFAVDSGNLKILDKSGEVYWSTGLDSDQRYRYEAKLTDSGNLILTRNQMKIIWQSFENPTDTFLLGMRMNPGFVLTSWTNHLDPAPGDFTFELDEEQENQLVIKQKGYIDHWKSGDFGGFFNSDEIPPLMANFLFNSYNNSRAVMNYNLTSTMKYNNTRIVMNFTGEIQYWSTNIYKKEMSLLWLEPSDKCSVFDACGSFGSCNTNNELACKCLPGFRPTSLEQWVNGEFSGGCTRNFTTPCSESDIFLKLSKMRVGNTKNKFLVDNEKDCKRQCLINCQCVAYSYTEEKNNNRRGAASGIPTCWIWTEYLKNLQEDVPHGGQELYVRSARSDLARSCEACGTYVIPYPLSTSSSCGDPMYFSFYCNDSTGKLSFNAPIGTYIVTSIDATTRTFIIQEKADNCSVRTNTVLQLNKSLSTFPYKLTNVTHRCNSRVENLSSANPSEGTEEIEISWIPPPEPICNSSADCKDWPLSSCKITKDRRRSCLCNANFRWDGTALNCTAVEEDRTHHTSLIIGVTVASFLIFSCVIASICICIYRRTMAKRQEIRDNIEKNRALLYGTEKRLKDLIGSEEFKEEDKKRIDVPFFELESILAATDNFSDESKLGRGGFGPVYKGTFQGGQEIAVKRLLSVSGQGLEEFKNEVVLIARLQHRNLVKLLGYCIKGNEKILLYEYMPNKSLDYFIFDEKLGLLLNWELRLNIILGVARGLLYLHQDSRLRIIHRDLKTSNILLDTEMNPKISDFGLARIFEGKQTEGMTNRVVGTYGYMPPEYALDGLFSVKSDVFSFGVVVLEILSGRRNTRMFNPEEATNLLGYAWRLWREDKAMEFMDKALRESCKMDEFLKCLHVAILCVQEDPTDRPTMSTVVVLLSSQIASLPIPMQPAFVERKGLSGTASSSSSSK